MMTCKEAKTALKKNYMEALSFFAEYLEQFEGRMYEELKALDEKIFDRANKKWGLGDEWLQIYSALLIAVEKDEEY